MKELKLQLVSALLVIVTVAAVIAAGFNFNQQNKYHLPDDGVIWVDQPSGETVRVVALRVQAGSPGAKAGLTVSGCFSKRMLIPGPVGLFRGLKPLMSRAGLCQSLVDVLDDV